MRDLLILLLEDKHGIPADAYFILMDMMNESTLDIVESVRFQDNRAFLPVGWSIE